jgi:transcription elongation factor Elf1
MDARCDECGKAFAVMTQTRRNGDIETTFFTCAHCGREYIVCRTNSAIRGLGTQVNRQRQRNGERQRCGELTKRHIGCLQRKVNHFKAGLDAVNRAE